MAERSWTLDAADGTLTLHTGVTGPASRMGHRLTIEMTTWRATVGWDGDAPVSADLIVNVDSLRVVSGEGGVTPLSGPEKVLVRSNASKTLNVKRFPTIEFRAESITARDGGYLLAGLLRVHGVSQPVEVGLDVRDEGAQWRLQLSAEVSQAAHGVKPYSMAMGAMKVADAVAVTFTATCPKDS